MFLVTDDQLVLERRLLHMVVAEFMESKSKVKCLAKLEKEALSNFLQLINDNEWSSPLMMAPRKKAQQGKSSDSKGC